MFSNDVTVLISMRLEELICKEQRQSIVVVDAQHHVTWLGLKSSPGTASSILIYVVSYVVSLIST